MQRDQVTLATQTIHREDEPRHFMRLKPVPRRIRILKDSQVLADTEAALRLTEVGRDIYDPVFYIPEADVQVDLVPIIGKSTHCPLKGDASYFAHTGDEPIAWTYDRPLAATEALKGLIAFYPDQVVVEEIGQKA
ncbi:DUF427 domain-containing protein [Pararhizobium sp. IMCC21322]|uniref:DUF427 domain-containing protein n=1 Tax=Pararhizobium sp. IMCC21322 TaxID=3067903 RepID=UPI00274056EC|nr:DUF427 domain-containing protein [Pararhizobium sp. IMCC21322]